MVIVPSQSDTIMEDWVRATRLPDDYILETLESGYMNNKLALIWIKHFNECSKKKQVGEWRMLLMDNYGSHQTYEFLSYCLENKILPYFLPPHTTQLLQPLDRCVFQPYKHYHGEAIGNHNRMGCGMVTKVDFLDYLDNIRKQTMKRGTIQRAWRLCGIWPFNPSIVLDTLEYTTTSSSSEDIEHSPQWRTPTNKQEADTLCDATYDDVISPTEAFYKMKKALDVAYTQLNLMSNQISAMTAAQCWKADLNASKRQVLTITGEP